MVSREMQKDGSAKTVFKRENNNGDGYSIVNVVTNFFKKTTEYNGNTMTINNGLLSRNTINYKAYKVAWNNYYEKASGDPDYNYIDNFSFRQFHHVTVNDKYCWR